MPLRNTLYEAGIVTQTFSSALKNDLWSCAGPIRTLRATGEILPDITDNELYSDLRNLNAEDLLNLNNDNYWRDLEANKYYNINKPKPKVYGIDYQRRTIQKDRLVLIEKILAERQKQRSALGRKAKTYTIDSTVRKKIASSAVRLKKRGSQGVSLLTFTFPCDVSEIEANKAWSRFTDNMKQNFGLLGYVAVRELTARARSHFHALLKMPNVAIQKINKAWCSSITKIPGMKASKNCVRHKPGSPIRVKNVRKAVLYICKYMCKAGTGAERYISGARIYFIDHEFLSQPKEISQVQLDKILSEFAHNPRRYEHCTVIEIDNYFHTTEEISAAFSEWDRAGP